MFVEVARGPAVDAPPMIIVQRRDDEPTYAMTVAEAHAFLADETNVCQPCTNHQHDCVYCMVSEAVQGLA